MEGPLQGPSIFFPLRSFPGPRAATFPLRGLRRPYFPLRLGSLPVNPLGKLGQLLVGLFFFVERLFQQRNVLVFAQQFSKRSDGPIAAHLVVLDSLSDTEDCRVFYL